MTLSWPVMTSLPLTGTTLEWIGRWIGLTSGGHGQFSRVGHTSLPIGRMRDLSAPCILVLGNQSHTASEQALIQTPVYLLVSTTMNGAITLWCLVKGDTSLF